MSSHLGTTALRVFCGIAMTVFVASDLSSVSAAGFGELWDKYGGKSQTTTKTKEIVLPAAPVMPAENAGGNANQRVFLDRGASGRFYVDGEINGRTIKFVVDTGATTVALTKADAERLGVTISRLRPLGLASSAGGPTRMYRLRLSSITIGNIAVRDIQAVVVPAASGRSLLGMTFLSRLKSYGVQNGKMYLEGGS